MKDLEDFIRPTQRKLFKQLCKKFKGNLLVSKGNFILVRGVSPVMLVAHLDTVHENPVRDLCLSPDKNILMSPQGIGGDDRCGVFALCKVYQLSKEKPWLLFCCNEEIGGVGAKNFCLAHQQHLLPKELDDLSLIIELDRKGKNDAVYYHCDNSDFETYVTGKGFKTAQGSFSDISHIAPELSTAAVNLSCGYFNAHSLHEYINRSYLDSTIQKVIGMVSDSSQNGFPRFKYIEKFCSTSSKSSICQYHNLAIYGQSRIPHNLPDNLFDIYEALLDFYSSAELESFRKEYGDSILLQIYNEEVSSFYH